MADLIRKNTEPTVPQNDNGGFKIFFLLVLIVAVVFTVLYAFTHSTVFLVIGGLCFLLSIAVFFAGLSSKPKYNDESKQYGDEGERRAGFILERYLPDGYTVIQNAKIHYGDGVSEIDNIIVGKSGVFIVEVKNMKGKIIGDYSEKYWIQDKIDQYDIEHTKEFYSPVKQIGTHIFRLANFLRDEKIFTNIKGAVYFANPETKLFLSGEPNDIPVFSYRLTSSLIEYIASSGENLSDKTIERILNVLR